VCRSREIPDKGDPNTRYTEASTANPFETKETVRSIDMLHEQTHEKLIAMKLFGIAASLKERLERRDHQDLSKPEFFGLLVDDEWLYRENRKLTARLKVAKFKQRAAAIEAIDYSIPRGIR
jgi:hypothetical protein